MRGVRGAALLLTAVVVAACDPRGAPREGTGEAALPPDEDLGPPLHCDVSAPPPGIRTVQVVFTCEELPVGTWRPLPDDATDTLTFALRELLAGPTAQEREAGLTSFFSAETAGMLNRADVRDGVAFVDFADFSRIIPNASTSAGSAQLLDQLAGTIFQFDGIRAAEVTFAGSCEAFWNWIQRGCERLTRDGA